MSCRATLPDSRELARRIDREVALSGAIPVLTLRNAGDEAPAVSIATHLQSAMLWLGPASPALVTLAPPRRVVRVELPVADAMRTRTALLARWRRWASPAKDDDADMIARVGTCLVAVSSRTGGTRRNRGPARRHRAVATALTPCGAPRAKRHAADSTRWRSASSRRASFDGSRVAGAADHRAARHRAAAAPPRARVSRMGLRRHARSRAGSDRAVRRRVAARARRWPPRRSPTSSSSTSIASISRRVVSKYIGETEKNLQARVRRGRGERSGAAVRRGRCAVRQAQRGERQPRPLRQHRGRLSAAADRGVSRPGDPDHEHEERARSRLPAPASASSCSSRFPTRAARAEIWRRQFSPLAPIATLDYDALARLTLAGGHIRSVAVNAAFRAADGEGVIDHRLLADAARAELLKLDRSTQELA